MCICIEEGQHIGRNGKGHLFGLARLQCHFRKTFQFLLRANNGCLAVRYIELYYLLSCTCACIGNRDCDLITIQGSFAVCECCIAQAKAEWESRFAFRRIDGVLYALGHILQRTACTIQVGITVTHEYVFQIMYLFLYTRVCNLAVLVRWVVCQSRLDSIWQFARWIDITEENICYCMTCLGTAIPCLQDGLYLLAPRHTVCVTRNRYEDNTIIDSSQC